MKRSHIGLFGFVLLSLGQFQSANAEICWMVGCKDQVAYVRVERSEPGQYLPFGSTARPKVGHTSALCADAALRAAPFAESVEQENSRLQASPPGHVNGNRLGVGSKVKVLDIVERDGRSFAVVRVVSDDRTQCPKGCGQCSQGCLLTERQLPNRLFDADAQVRPRQWRSCLLCAGQLQR
jgi:hypothetical protein